MLEDGRQDRVAARLEAIDVVHRRADPGLRDALCAFYGGILEMEAKGASGREAARVLHFRSERIELQIALDSPAPTPAAPVRLVVRSLSAVARRLQARRIRFQWFHGLSLTDQKIVTTDPAENRLELTQTWPL